MKAYRVTWSKMPDCPVVVAAPTRGAATYATYLRYRDQRRDMRIVEFRTIRAPELDGAAAAAAWGAEVGP